MSHLLVWEGELRRKRLLDLFGMKAARASQWLQEFNAWCPRWTRWNPLTKSHVATSVAHADAQHWTALERSRSLEHYLLMTRVPLAAREHYDEAVVWSAFSDLAVPRSDVFSAIHRAISGGMVLDSVYRSLRNPEPHARTLSPHSLIRAGRRWHVRAYCREVGDFRDFALGRFVSVQVRAESRERSAADDTAWNQQVDVELIVHPGLSDAQQRVVRGEYFNDLAGHVEPCRACLVPYFLPEIRATLTPDRDPAPAWLIAVANPEELRPWMFE